jgi:hypothetical protein
MKIELRSSGLARWLQEVRPIALHALHGFMASWLHGFM